MNSFSNANGVLEDNYVPKNSYVLKGSYVLKDKNALPILVRAFLVNQANELFDPR